MKKIILAVCALSTPQVFAAEQTGVINFNGIIYNATCAIDINGNEGGENATVNMGRHPTSAFPSRGSESSGVGDEGKIKIELKDCPDQGTLSVSFTGKTVDSTGDLLELDKSGQEGIAKGIGIALYDEDGEDILIDGTPVIQKKFKDGQSEYKYQMLAKYYRYAEKDSDFNAGRADATLNFKIEYK